MTAQLVAGPKRRRVSREVAVGVLGVATLVLVAACGGGSGAGLTVAPVTAAPSVVAASPNVSPVEPTSVTAAPSGSAAPASPAPAPATPTAPSTQGAAPTPAPTSGPSATVTPTPAPGPSGSPAASGATGSTIELDETEDLQLLQNGQPVTQLTVKLGDAIVFKIDNSADFQHTFYIGPANLLANDQTDGLPGLPNVQGTQELTYTVTADTANLEFGCPLEGHYPTMHGTFVVTP